MQRCVFARKGKRETPEIKAKFVGRKFAERDGRDGEVFAGTPELMAVRRLLTTHCTTRHGSRQVSVRLPDWRLVKLIYSWCGARDTPMIWADCLA